MTRLRLLTACSLVFALLTVVVAQEKKEPVPPAKKDEGKKEAPPVDPKVVPKPDPKATPPVDPKVAPKPDPKATPPVDPKVTPPVVENPLGWKFVKDQAFWQVMTTTTTQSIKVQGLDVGQNQEQTFIFKFDPMNQVGDKWIIKQTIEGVKMRIDIAGSPVSYDSTNEAAGGGSNTALSEFFKALKGSQFTLTIGKDMTVEKVEGRDEFVKKLVAANKQLEQLLTSILGEEALRQMADPSFGVVPKEAKKVGEKWSKNLKLGLGPLGNYDNTYNFTYLKQTGDIAEIDVAVELKYTPPAADQGGGALPFKIKAGRIDQVKDEKYNKGKVMFNTKLGRLESSNVSVKMTGELTLDIGGTTTVVTLTQDQTTDVKTFDKSPIVEKK